MKEIYFACSIRGGRDDADTYAKIVTHIKKSAIVLSEIFADGKLTADGMNKPSEEIWKNDIDWVKQADGLIAEVSNPSLGVGYEIAYAENIGKPILALYRNQDDKKLSAMIDGAPGVTVCRYSDMSDAYSAIDKFLESFTPDTQSTDGADL